MSRGTLYSRGRYVAAKAARALRIDDLALDRLDLEGLRYVATMAVRAHWFIIAVLLFELVYRPYPGVAKYALLLMTLVGFNAYIHYRLRSNRPITWRWVLALFALDIFLISAVLTLSDGFSHQFFHLFFYGALAGSAVIFASFTFNVVWVTVVALIYTGISLTVGDGLDLEAKDEKTMVARIAVMYTVVIAVNLATRFERIRWRQAVERERSLQSGQVRFSRAVHDTTAQAAYMIGLGIDTAKAQAGDANPELAATLDATSRLCRSTMWELRHPINRGDVYEGRELGWALRSHTASFTNITSVPAEMTQTGVEPPLTIETKGLLFSIAHNALTNAYRHAEASRVSVHIEFGETETRLSVSDDGIGLPADYAKRGHGFTNMSGDAERLGGRLVVNERGDLGGATVTCVIPPQPNRKEMRDAIKRAHSGAGR